jgi:hypothetical protein
MRCKSQTQVPKGDTSAICRCRKILHLHSFPSNQMLHAPQQLVDLVIERVLEAKLEDSQLGSLRPSFEYL